MAEDGEGAGLRHRPRPPHRCSRSTASRSSFVPAPDLVEWIFDLPRGRRPLESRSTPICGLPCSRRSGPRPRTPATAAPSSVKPSSARTSAAWANGSARGLQQQILEWFGSGLISCSRSTRPYAEACDDATFCALVEHELSHCGQERDEFGMPRFKKSTGMPAFCMRGHDVEEFVGVVRRYGADAPASAP
jgi:hypothetical protein